MKEAGKKKDYWLWLLLAIATIIMLMVYFGIAFPINYQEYFAKNLTYNLPDKTLHWLAWPILFIAFAKVLTIPFDSSIDPRVQAIYHRHIYKHFQWLLISIIILFLAIGFNQSLVFLLMGAFGHLQAFSICEIVSSQEILRQPASMIKIPIGHSLGWLLFQNYLAIVEIGSDIETENFIIFFSLLALTVFLIRAFYLFIKLGNPAIVIGIFWGLIELLLNQSPFSSNTYKNQIFFWGLLLLTVITIILYYRYYRMYRQQQEEGH